MEFKDYYNILGVKPDDDKPAIKKAYRRLAHKYHPDVSSEHDAEKKFKEVSEAYEVLGDDTTYEYDQLRRYGSKGEHFTPPPDWERSGDGASASHGDFSEFFESIFGGGVGGTPPQQSWICWFRRLPFHSRPGCGNRDAGVSREHPQGRNQDH